MFRRLDERFLVAGQIHPEHIAAAKASGVTMIVNNRPDGEQPGQPSGEEIEKAARAAGLDYRFIPVGAAGLGRAQIDAMASAIEDGEGLVLAYCLSGTRSVFLWALARAARGEDGASLMARRQVLATIFAPSRRRFGHRKSRGVGRFARNLTREVSFPLPRDRCRPPSGGWEWRCPSRPSSSPCRK